MSSPRVPGYVAGGGVFISYQPGRDDESNRCFAIGLSGGRKDQGLLPFPDAWLNVFGL